MERKNTKAVKVCVHVTTIRTMKCSMIITNLYASEFWLKEITR